MSTISNFGFCNFIIHAKLWFLDLWKNGLLLCVSKYIDNFVVTCDPFTDLLYGNRFACGQKIFVPKTPVILLSINSHPEPINSLLEELPRSDCPFWNGIYPSAVRKHLLWKPLFQQPSRKSWENAYWGQTKLRLRPSKMCRDGYRMAMDRIGAPKSMHETLNLWAWSDG